MMEGGKLGATAIETREIREAAFAMMGGVRVKWSAHFEDRGSLAPSSGPQ